MVKLKELGQSWKKIGSQIEESKRFLDEQKIDEALYFIWIAAENLVNCLKVTVNGIYLKEHRAKTDILKAYFAAGTLKKDYSRTFEKLSKYRIAAEFHPYTSIKRDYTKEDVKRFLEEIEGLKAELSRILKERGVL